MNHVQIEAYIRIESVDQKKKKEFFEKKKEKNLKKSIERNVANREQ